ncbi:hypothetical protein [Microbacterium sp.]|uniref:hypothetical protein n=1 Tax=Microbacterium sp. TaxID=51671 RepID=UPI003C78AFB1
MRHADATTIRTLLRTRDDLTGEGYAARQLMREATSGALTRVRRGRYVAREEWVTLWPESKHLAHVLAVSDSATTRPVFAFTSAAALHGLPLFRVRAERVHTIHPDAARRTNGTVIRHCASLDESDVVEIDGVLCTSLERTVYDLARLASAEVALVCLDTALGGVGGDPRWYDDAAAAQWLAGIEERVGRMPGARGIRHARALLEVADGRSQQPLEIVTKLQLRRLGFRQPGLQVPVPAPSGGSYWLDLELEESGAFYECDGETKYTDEAMRSGRTLEQVLLDEKRREDWVRGTTGKRVVRGGTPHSVTPAALAGRLQSFGIELPDPRHRLLLPRRPFVYGQ